MEGDKEAFRALVRRYQDALYNFCFRLTGFPEDAEELAQETFIKAYRNLVRFDVGRKFSTWIFTIAHNLAIDKWRAKGPREVSWDEEVHDAEFASSIGRPERDVVLKETGAELEWALLQLPYNYKAAVVLRHVEGLSYREISQIIGVPEGTAKTWVHRGCSMLRKTMEKVTGYEV